MHRHITFIHGISNKPPKEKLLNEWKNALSINQGIPLDALGVTSSMVYWADVYHEAPSNYDFRNEGIANFHGNVLTKDALEYSWRNRLSSEEKIFLQKFEESLGVKLEEINSKP